MAKAPDDLIAAYLRRLADELRDLPKPRRTELVEEIREHIAEARTGLPSQDEVDVRNLLERLGDPGDIAAEARERFGIPPAKSGAREILALIFLPIGGVLLPFLGWFVGMALLWTSRVWTSRDKWIGTLLFPGGLAVPFFLAVFATSGGSCPTVSGGTRVIQTTCTGGPSGPEQALVVAGMIVLVVVPIATFVYLLVRLRRRTEVPALP